MFPFIAASLPYWKKVLAFCSSGDSDSEDIGGAPPGSEAGTDGFSVWKRRGRGGQCPTSRRARCAGDAPPRNRSIVRAKTREAAGALPLLPATGSHVNHYCK